MAAFTGVKLTRARVMDPALSAELALDHLNTAALNHRAVRHPYLAAIAAGDLPDPAWALADFAHQYAGYSAHFPRYLTCLISRLENPAHREALLANLVEESGQYGPEEIQALAEHGIEEAWIAGVPHPALFQRFRTALTGAVAEEPAEDLELVCWREMLLAVLSQGSAAEAVGALGLGTEAVVAAIYAPFLKAIERHGGLAPRDTVFFALHSLVDDAHQATLRRIALDFAATGVGQRDLARGMYKALALRDSFWSWLHERALGGRA